MKKIITLLLSSVAIVFCLFGAFLTAQAQAIPVNDYNFEDPCDKYGVSVGCPDQDETVIETKVGDFIGYALMVAGALAAVFLIIGGVSFATSGGDPEKVKKAKRTVLYSVIGLALALIANIIVNLVINTAEDLTNTTEETTGYYQLRK